jgi:hypothetical protein
MQSLGTKDLPHSQQSASSSCLQDSSQIEESSLPFFELANACVQGAVVQVLYMATGSQTRKYRLGRLSGFPRIQIVLRVLWGASMTR